VLHHVGLDESADPRLYAAIERGRISAKGYLR
jgi:hypothetical protein